MCLIHTSREYQQTISIAYCVCVRVYEVLREDTKWFTIYKHSLSNSLSHLVNINKLHSYRDCVNKLINNSYTNKNQHVNSTSLQLSYLLEWGHSQHPQTKHKLRVLEVLRALSDHDGIVQTSLNTNPLTSIVLVEETSERSPMAVPTNTDRQSNTQLRLFSH